MSTGFLLGKFAPLHKGHQLLIETALAESSRVLVMVYHAPDVTDVPLPVRVRWIKSLYPRVTVIEAWDGPLEVGESPDLQRRHEEYILSRLNGLRVDRFYSSEFYGAHVSRALQAEDRRVDEPRGRVPISATEIRCDPYRYRHFMAPLVYRDLVSRVVFLGAPSTGKTTLAEALAERYDTQWMPEYGREYWERHQRDRRLSAEQLVLIAQEHRSREDSLAEQANRYLFVDTDASTTRHFSRHYHDRVDPRLDALAEETASRYDLVFLCEDDTPYDDSWDRSGETRRRIFQSQVRAELAERRIPHISLRGSLQQRMRQVDRVLQGFRKYRSLVEDLAAPSGTQ